MRTVRCRRSLALLVSAIMLLVACGDDESSAPATTVPPSTTTPQVELDRQKAQRLGLTAADLPGFTMAPDTGGDSADLEAATNACVNNDPLLVRLGEDDDPRGASSADFKRGETLTVHSGVTFGESEDQTRVAMAAIGASSFPGCFSDALTTELRKNATLTDVTVTTTRLPALSVGDESVGYRSTARARVGGQSVTFYFDFTFMRSGRALSVISGLGVNAPFPEADRSRLATTIAGRMAAP